MVNIEYRVTGMKPSDVSGMLEEAVAKLLSHYNIGTSDGKLIASIDGTDPRVVVIRPNNGATIYQFLAVPKVNTPIQRLVGEGGIHYYDPKIPAIGLTLGEERYEIQFKSQET